MDVAARRVQKLLLQCHKQHKTSKVLFAYLILTEGIRAGPLPGQQALEWDPRRQRGRVPA